MQAVDLLGGPIDFFGGAESVVQRPLVIELPLGQLRLAGQQRPLFRGGVLIQRLFCLLQRGQMFLGAGVFLRCLGQVFLPVEIGGIRRRFDLHAAKLAKLAQQYSAPALQSHGAQTLHFHKRH